MIINDIAHVGTEQVSLPELDITEVRRLELEELNSFCIQFASEKRSHQELTIINPDGLYRQYEDRLVFTSKRLEFPLDVQLDLHTNAESSL